MIFCKEDTLGKSLKNTWFTFRPMPIIEELICSLCRVFSIRIPQIFFFDDKMSFAHLTAKSGIYSFFKARKIAKDTSIFSRKWYSEERFSNFFKILNVRFLPGSEIHLAPCCPLPCVCERAHIQLRSFTCFSFKRFFRYVLVEFVALSLIISIKCYTFVALQK